MKAHLYFVVRSRCFPAKRVPGCSLLALAMPVPAGRRQRRSASVTISVAMLLDCLEDWMSARGSRDIGSMLAPVAEGMTFKTRPRAAPLAAVADLASRLAAVAANGAVPPTKMSSALRVAHQAKACNYSGLQIEVWAENMGSIIRLMLSKFMELKAEPQYTRTMTKAFWGTHLGRSFCLSVCGARVRRL